MTRKEMYLNCIQMLNDLDYRNSDLSNDEQEAIQKTQDVLARFYAQECIKEINRGYREQGKDVYLEYFCDETIERAKAYCKGSEIGLREFLENKKQQA